MTEIAFKGSGETFSENEVGKGAGLGVGLTKIEFGSGRILTQGTTQSLIGKFRTIIQKGGNENVIRSLHFKAATKCTLKWKQTSFEYNLLNEWVVIQGITIDTMEIERSATGISPDVFDWQFMASDAPDYTFHIEKGTRDSDTEILFASESRAVNTHLKVFNTQNASKLILVGKATAGTGTGTFTIEVFDPASGSWVELVPVDDLFTLVNGETKTALVGAGIDRTIKSGQGHGLASALGAAPNVTVTIHQEGDVIGSLLGGEYGGGLTRAVQYPLPSGDNILRLKAVVTTAALTFSVGVIKVFN